jgi:SAM-dependent methyltransferase
MAQSCAPIENDRKELGSATKDRTRFREILLSCVRSERIDLQGSVLIVGGSFEDAEILRQVGFRRITLTNLQDLADFKPPLMDGVELNALNADAEDMQIADGAYDLVLAHEVLHHCRSPHKALVEMLRVSRRHVIILEPNDSLLMHAFVKLRFSIPFELPAVIFHNFQAGGVRNSCVPNYIFRWSERDMYQTTASYIPEFEFGMHVRAYWDFNVDKNELALRSHTRIGTFTRILGPGLFITCLHCFQAVMNRFPWLSRQGNKYFGCITKHDSLKPWLVLKDGQIAYNRTYEKH